MIDGDGAGNQEGNDEELSERVDVPFVSMDERLSAAAEREGFEVLSFD